MLKRRLCGGWPAGRPCHQVAARGGPAARGRRVLPRRRGAPTRCIRQPHGVPREGLGAQPPGARHAVPPAPLRDARLSIHFQESELFSCFFGGGERVRSILKSTPVIIRRAPWTTLPALSTHACMSIDVAGGAGQSRQGRVCVCVRAGTPSRRKSSSGCSISWPVNQSQTPGRTTHHAGRRVQDSCEN